jgi:hypothetical protein
MIENMKTKNTKKAAELSPRPMSARSDNRTGIIIKKAAVLITSAFLAISKREFS